MVSALAHGTETVPRVDVIAGPGSPYVQEAKLMVSGAVGIDGYLGPSDVFIVAGDDADPDLILTDLLAQAEHGTGTIVALAASPMMLDAVAPQLELDSDAVCGLVEVQDPVDGLEVAEAFAPEHLQLMGTAAERLAPSVRRAGAVFVGGGTAFGDYVAGSNHSLPTGGSARFGSALSVRHFRRRMSEVHIGDAAGVLARAGAPVARAEGFELHAQSMEARQNGGLA
jgi:histidinol dehydrogenase